MMMKIMMIRAQNKKRKHVLRATDLCKGFGSNMTFFCPGMGRAQNGPPDKDHGHELGYVFARWEVPKGGQQRGWGRETG